MAVKIFLGNVCFKIYRARDLFPLTTCSVECVCVWGGCSYKHFYRKQEKQRNKKIKT